MIRRTAEYVEDDAKYLAEFEEAMRHMTGLVEEAFVTTPQYLLSPILRELIRDHARKLERMRQALANKLCVDSAGHAVRPKT